MVPQGTDVNYIGGVEFKVSGYNCFPLLTTWPEPFYEDGVGLGNHILRFHAPVQVVDGQGVLGAVFFVNNGRPFQTGYLTLNPSVPATIPGFMAFRDFVDPDVAMALTPSEGLFGSPMVTINYVVGEERSSLDGIKALYR